MADAQPRRLEYEDRVAVFACPFAKRAMGVGGDIAHQHPAQIKLMVGRHPVLRPALQHMGDARIGKGCPVAVVVIVHRHHIGHQIASTGGAGIVGHGDQAVIGLDDETGVIEVPYPHGTLRRQPAERHRLHGSGFGAGQRHAVAGDTRLCPQRQGQRQQQCGGPVQHRLALFRQSRCQRRHRLHRAQIAGGDVDRQVHHPMRQL